MTPESTCTLNKQIHRSKPRDQKVGIDIEALLKNLSPHKDAPGG